MSTLKTVSITSLTETDAQGFIAKELDGTLFLVDRRGDREVILGHTPSTGEYIGLAYANDTLVSEVTNPEEVWNKITEYKLNA